MKTATYIAILGRQPEFGLVELESRLGAVAVLPFGRQAALVTSAIDTADYGSVVKVGKVIYEGPAKDVRPLPLNLDDLPLSESKTPFAVSVYGMHVGPKWVVSAGLELKKALKGRGSLRFVAPSEGLTTSAAQLKFNNVIDKGFELLVAQAGSRVVIAITTSVQDIDWYAKRDYDRPARSAKVGMLPPKLAKMLVNTTASPMVVDPFCGTGVVLQEALLLGRSAIGSDLAEDMVDASQQNLIWLKDQAPTALLPWQVSQADARVVKLPDADCAIVSEGYLGPNLSATPSPAHLAEMRTELLDLYRATLKNLGSQLERGAELALCTPVWRTGQGWQYLGIVDELSRLGYTCKVFKHVSTSLLYARADQVVGRHILLLRKQ